MAETNSGDTSPGSSSPSPATQDPDPEPTPGESSTKPSRYELQKLRDWKSFRRYLNNHDPTLSLATCTGSDVVEFLKHLDQVGKTKIHVTGCAFFGHPKPPSPCDCPLRQSWGNLDSLVYRLRALYEEKRCNPGTNPFGAPDVQGYLREVRQYQARARGIDYGKKRKQQLPALPIIDPPDPKKHSSAMYGYETGGALIPRTQNQLGPYVPAVPIWIRPPDLPIQYWASTMLNSIPTGTQEKGHIDWEESESVVPPSVRRNASMKDGITEQPPKGILKKPRASIEPKKQHQQKEMIEVELPMVVVVPVCGSGIDGSRVLSWRDDRVASLIISRIQLQIGSTELGYPIINKERFGRELEALEERGEKWSNPWFLSLLDDTLRGLPRALRGLEVKVRRGCECGKVRWVDQVETEVEGIDV